MLSNLFNRILDRPENIPPSLLILQFCFTELHNFSHKVKRRSGKRLELTVVTIFGLVVTEERKAYLVGCIIEDFLLEGQFETLHGDL